MIEIAVLNGNPGAGKDTFVKLVKRIYPAWHFSYNDYVIKTLCQLDREYFEKIKTKSDKIRQLLASLNDAFEAYGDLPIKHLAEEVNNAVDVITNGTQRAIIFVDIRKPENIDRFKEIFPTAITVFVEDNKPINNVTVADSVVRNYHYDYIIENAGTIDDLRAEAKSFVTSLKESRRI